MRIAPKLLIALALVLVAHPADARPVSSNFGSSVSEQAYADFLIFSKGGSKAPANINFTIDPQLKSVYANQIKRDTLASVRMWSNDRAPSIKMDVYAAPTQHFQFIYDYMKQVLPPSQLANGWLDEKLRRSKSESSGVYGGGATGNSINGDDVFMAYVPNKYPINDAHWRSLVSHEYVHVVQRSLFHGSMAPMQCWVREGQANYIGWSYSGRSSVSSFASAAAAESLFTIPTAKACRPPPWNSLVTPMHSCSMASALSPILRICPSMRPCWWPAIWGRRQRGSPT